MQRYNPKDIESKWQKYWDDNQTYKADLTSDKPKYMAMSMFNYPSGAGIHIGHAMNYTISDIMARFKRQQGYESYHPIGWDSFGLPAENFAIKSGISPQASMAKIIPSYHTQYKAMGWSNDWSKEIATHEPEYYKWTQWIFSQMYKHGMAYQDNRMQWWCEKDNTVLSNEQVIDGKCWRHDGPDDPLVEKKEIKQWFFKITDYAEELLEATDALDWTETVKTAQKSWIGKSKGAEITFAVDGSEEKITVFTTRPDTLFGATFLVMAPESEQVSKLVTKEQAEAVKDYQKEAARKTEIERQASKEKTGVFTGAYVTNPVNGEKIPVWVADYVLSGYGTGAIMAVPAHDERDNEFARKFDLPIIEVVAPDFGLPLPDAVDVTGPVVVGYDPKTKQYMSLINTKNNMRWFAAGGLEPGETYEQAALRELGEEAGFHKVEKLIQLGGPNYSYFYNSNKDSNRRSFSYMFLAIIDSTETAEQHLESHEAYRVVWSDVDAIMQDLYKIPEGRGHWIDGMQRAQDAVAAYERGEEYYGPIITEEGVLFNSGEYSGLSTAVGRERIVADLSEPKELKEYSDGRNKIEPDMPIEERTAAQIIVQHPTDDTYLVLRLTGWDSKTHSLPMGGVDKGEDIVDAALRELREEAGFDDAGEAAIVATPYYALFYHELKKVNRKAKIYTVATRLKSLHQTEIAKDEKKLHEVQWVSIDELAELVHGEGCKAAIIAFKNGVKPNLGVAKDVTTYKIRDWSVSRQRYWGAPIPIIHCPKDGIVPVPDDQLPVVLPELTDFESNGDGRSALARATEWLHVDCPKCGGPAERETDTLDTYICSSWYMLRYLDPHNDKAAFSPEIANKWMPVDFYNGADHATAHMIYARFITRFFHKQGLVADPEPFKKFLFNGKVTAADGQMFSKSKGTGVDPLEIINSGYGADALRVFLMFAAPLDLWIKWDPQGVPGAHRFINRVWNVTQEYLEAKPAAGSSEEVLRIIHPVIKKVTADLEEQKYNTAIAALMKCVNELYELKARTKFAGGDDWRFALESLAMLIGPFAPHAAEQLWHDLGHEDSIHRDHWPEWDEKYLISDTMTIVVQVNGKLRAQLQLAKDTPEADIIAAAKADNKVKAHLGGEPKKTIYVPGKLVNFVV